MLDRGFQPFCRRRFGDEREGAAREAVLSILVERHNLNRDVARLGIVLQLTEDGPSEHVRQEDIERHGGGPELLGQCQGLGAPHRHERFQSFVAGEVGQNPSIVRIVFDNQQCRIVWLDIVPIVRHDFGGPLRHAHRGEPWQRRRVETPGCAARWRG